MASSRSSGNRASALALAIACAASLIAGPQPAMGGINVWTSHGPEGWYIAALAVDPSNPTTIYAGTGRGVFKSSDGGRSWIDASTGLPTPPLGGIGVAALAINPRNSTTVYAATDHGVFRSIDGASSWSGANTGLPPDGERISALAIDAASPTTLYAAQGRCGRGGCFGLGVFRSTDGGDSWHVTGLNDGYVSALTIDPLTPATLYASSYDSGVLKSIDGGDTWQVTDLNYGYVGVLAVDPVSSMTVYAGTIGVFKSVDGGSSWIAAGTGLPPGIAVGALAIDPTNSVTLYAGTFAGVFKSTDGGESWNALNTGLSNTVVPALGLDPVRPSHVYAGTGDGVFDIEALCGNGSVDAGEECDDGNLTGTDGCTVACTHCGDGIVTRPEECDDGNLVDGDCCSADCSMLAAIHAGPIANPANEHRYLLLASAPWSTSEVQAVCLGGHLATIDDAAENAWVYESFSVYGGVEHRLWIGLSDAAAEGIWTWSSGAPVIYTNWGVDEPDDCCGGQDYAYILRPSDPRGGFWDDAAEAGFGEIVQNGVVELADCGNGRIDAGEQCDDGNLDPADGCSLACTVCGDDRLTPPEECDDGDLADGDDCEADCTLPRCDNGIVDAGEECDDGNLDSTDGCTNACTICGNDIPTAPEECDDGNLVSNDSCDANCTVTRCGNGVVTSLEECDDGDLISGDGCDANCTVSRCGNGIVFSPEECDDGNLVDADGCEHDCTLPQCANGILDAGEECDDGNYDSGDGCDVNCTVSRCGNGAVGPPELCDDGNPVDGDGCDSNCTPTGCGNGIVTPPEECDEGDPSTANGCTVACTLCGNGVLTSPEQCDDANLACGDGCTPSCQPEVGIVAGPITNPANNNRYYLLAPSSWLAAEGQALCLGGHLITIDDASENAWAYEAFSPNGRFGRCLWIGLAKAASTGAWHWTSGAPLVFTNWGVFEPSSGEAYAYLFSPLDPQAGFWHNDAAAGAGCTTGSPWGLVEISDCGNGRIDAAEECDDGNQVNDDACRVTCRLPRCGDGIIDPEEECDDGNASPSDGCTNACTLCGNGVTTVPEECDDANSDPFDGCTTACTRCGNGVVTLFEGCDDGNLVDTDACTADCRLPSVTVGTGTSDTCTETMLDAALAAGRALTFECGDRPLTIRLISEKVITAMTTVDGGGMITLSGGHATRAFDVHRGATLNLRHLTIAAGSASFGGGIFNAEDGTVNMEDCTLRDNHGGFGGAIYSLGAVILTNCTLTDNSAEWGGGILVDGGTLALASSVLSRNLATHGGAIGNLGSTATLEDCILSDNSTGSAGLGGAIANILFFPGEPLPVLELASSTLTGNSSWLGGAIYNEGAVTIENSILSDNQSTGSGAGGAIVNFGSIGVASAALSDCTLSNNSAESGGAIFNESSGATLVDCTFSGNQARHEGGAIANGVDGTSLLTNCTLYGNSAGICGGAVYIWTGGAATLTNCKLSDNSAGHQGGAIFNSAANPYMGTPEGTLILNASTLNENAAANPEDAVTVGGAILNDGRAALTNCTLSENSATFGGGIYNARTGQSARITLTNSTLSGNSASVSGGGIYNRAAATLANTIVAMSAQKNCGGGHRVKDAGHNLQWPGADCGESIPSADPLLDPAGLQDNGGPTRTIALLASSPMINAGDPDVCARLPVNGVDQRGYPRPGAGHARCSIGAYEYVGSPGPTLTPTATAIPTPSDSATPTHTATPSPPPADTPTASATPKTTETPTSSLTPSQTPTDTPRAEPAASDGCAITPSPYGATLWWLLTPVLLLRWRRPTRSRPFSCIPPGLD